MPKFMCKLFMSIYLIWCSFFSEWRGKYRIIFIINIMNLYIVCVCSISIYIYLCRFRYCIYNVRVCLYKYISRECFPLCQHEKSTKKVKTIEKMDFHLLLYGVCGSWYIAQHLHIHMNTHVNCIYIHIYAYAYNNVCRAYCWVCAYV